MLQIVQAMDGTVLISRHRQWRAWQFGVRHSGLWRKSGDGGSWGEGPCNPDDWKKNAVIGAVIGLVLGGLLFVSPELFGKICGFFLFLGIIGWIIKLFL